MGSRLLALEERNHDLFTSHLQCAHLSTCSRHVCLNEYPKVFDVVIPGQGLKAWHGTAIEASEGAEKS